MTPAARVNVVLFMTRDMSLAAWDESGILAREIALYRHLAARGTGVTIVTYGNRDDQAFGGRLGGVRVCSNRWNLAPGKYRRWLPLLHAWPLARAHLVKTNQMPGADVAARVARLWRKPLVARCGFLWSKNFARSHGPHSEAARQALAVENHVFDAARRIVVTTRVMRRELGHRSRSWPAKTSIIPNYALVDRFRPDPEVPTRWDVAFVGRLAPEKNLDALLGAVQRLGLRALIIGDGPLRKPLARRWENADVTWAGRRDHLELPGLLNRSSLFVLPSFYEWHPKVLIEAMTCGRPVVGSDVGGIRDLIRHGKTGWLCPPDSESLVQALKRLLGDDELRRKLGRQARQFALRRFPLERVARMERTLYAHIGQRPQ